MEEKETQLNTNEENQNNGKMFTQEEVNHIIQSRLGNMRRGAQKSVQEEYDKKLAELEARERRLDAMEKIREAQLPDELADLIADSKDMDKAIEVLQKHYGKAAENKKDESLGFVNIGTEGGSGPCEPYDAIRKAMGIKR